VERVIAVGTFVLVHGAWHGGWCWDQLRAVLAERGHDSIAVDLPCEDGSATFEDYASVVLAAVPTDASEIVVVGHSLGGMTVPVVAARRPVQALVFLCPVIPNLSGTPWDDGPPMDSGGIFDPLVHHPDGATSWPDIESARAAFYADCNAQDAEWAFARLRRQNSTGLWRDPYPLTAWPDAERHVIAAADDCAITLDWVRHAARRLDVEPAVMPGGHSPFLARPTLLAQTLETVLA
jgi:pimeloyl-ACP methyl ester carboxylesterase